MDMDVDWCLTCQKHIVRSMLYPSRVYSSHTTRRAQARIALRTASSWRLLQDVAHSSVATPRTTTNTIPVLTLLRTIPSRLALAGGWATTMPVSQPGRPKFLPAHQLEMSFQFASLPPSSGPFCPLPIGLHQTS